MKTYFIAAALVAIPLSGFAADQNMSGEQLNEISTASSAIVFGGGQTFSANLALGYHRRMQNALDGNVQLGGQFQTNLSDGENDFTLLVGPTLNYKLNNDTDLENAAFITAMAGMSIAKVKAVDAATDFAYTVSVGKRFGINKTVSWKPEFAIGKGGNFSGTKSSFRILPFQFSFFF